MIPLLLTLAQADDRALLTQGVETLVAPGALPGSVVASEKAFVVLRAGDSPLFAAAPVGAGRAMVGGHGAFLGRGENARFFRNALTWLGRGRLGRVGVVGEGVEGARRLGAETVVLTRDDLQLVGIDVLVMSQGALDGDPKAQGRVMDWVRAGHGLYTAGPGWGWQQLNPSKRLRTDLAANRMLMPYGLGLTGETEDGKPTVLGADDPLLQTGSAMAALRSGNASPVAVGTVSRALALAPLKAGLAAEVRRRAALESGAYGPSRAKPVTTKMPFSRLRAVLDDRAWEEASPEKVKAAPSAADFPGMVPASARRVSRTVAIDPTQPGWQPMGLYAAPGEVVIVRTSVPGHGLGVRIGPHTDTLWHLDRWERAPSISRRWPLDATVVRIASPYGGTILLDVAPGAVATSVTVERAVAAPTFFRGKTTATEWAQMLATPGAPWVELVGKDAALSLPRSAVTTLKDPEALMAFWDETMARCYELYAAPHRPRPERYCVDRQISAGYMHSGYPIMTGDDVAGTFANLDKLRGKGHTWGFFHEVGHNFQRPDWTFSGTGEVTNNLFSLYGSEKLNGITPATYGIAHPAMAPDAQRKRLAGYLAKGAKFSDWRGDPFLALTMYAQVRGAFGWQPFVKAFASYGPDALRGDIAKHDAWMSKLSRETGRNLAPFFVAWGVPTSDAARDALKSLPEWMPTDWPKG